MKYRDGGHFINRGCNSGCIKIIYAAVIDIMNIIISIPPRLPKHWLASLTGKNFIDIISKHRSQSLKQTAISDWSLL